ncbi:hypothetical protein RHMOL_Rhmol09G0250500 [Rhododendron molle]|uniref:Uncharacterized protein n=1 Tax=Rhododendron molle TaxID=49168 RepID=A0ACC0MIW3_RHOML|nr:hypothetical protein RHMOL_Rhmol09G0250500 [Rhododendron molle]
MRVSLLPEPKPSLKETIIRERSRNFDDPLAEIRALGKDRSKVMGLITSSFPFIVGTVCGIYIAQKYDVPNIKKVFNDAFSKAKHIEEKYRKPKRGD